MDIKDIFNEFALAFEKKIDQEYFIKLQFEISDVENGIWQIDVNNGKVFVYNEVKIEPESTFLLTKETLLKMYNNEISAITAFANEPNEKGEMCGLIDLKYKREDKKTHWFKPVPEDLKKYIIRLHKFSEFFSKDYPTKIIVKKGNCRTLHNVDAIGLYNDFEKGILHTYFSIKKGEILILPTYDARIFVLNGHGVIRWGNEKYDIKEKEYYHINPMIEVELYIENYEETPLEILYI